MLSRLGCIVIAPIVIALGAGCQLCFGERHAAGFQPGESAAMVFVKRGGQTIQPNQAGQVRPARFPRALVPDMLRS